MNNIILLGHGVGVKLVIQTLLNTPDLGYVVTGVVTHPRKDHERDLRMIEEKADVYGEFAYNVFNVAEDFGVSLMEADDVNDDLVIEWIDNHNPHYIISIGCRNIIRKTFLEKYPGRVLNIHTTPLPKYRGAASDSWMILNNEWGQELYGCMHFIDQGIDTGDIVSKGYYEIPKKAYPIDVFKKRMGVFEEVVINGLKNLETGQKLVKQITNESTTFPRLYTPVDGRINFEIWNGEEIERFIYAFSYPFEGAHCFLGKKKININEVEYHTSSNFHPFSIGLIFGKNDNSEYKVSVRGGYLLLKKVSLEGKEIDQKKMLRLGKYLK